MRQRDIIARIEAIEKRFAEQDFREKYTPLLGKRVVGTDIRVIYSTGMCFDGDRTVAPWEGQHPARLCQGILENVDSDTLSIRDPEHPDRVWIVREAQELKCE